MPTRTTITRRRPPPSAAKSTEAKRANQQLRSPPQTKRVDSSAGTQNTSARTERYLYVGDLRSKLNVTDRCIRKWIKAGILPKPDGALGSRNYWLGSTIEKWEGECRAGKYDRKHRNFRQSANVADAPAQSPSNAPA